MSDTKRYGKKYRVLTDAATHAWDLLSFWTSARDVEMDDGTTVQNKLEAVETATNGNTIAIGEIDSHSGATITGAPNYDQTKKYSKGDIVNYNGTFYYCLIDITTPEAWNPAHWSAVVDAIPFRFGIDPNGKYGYYKAGADSVTPFSGKMTFITALPGNQNTYTFDKHYSHIMVMYYGWRYYSWIGDEGNRFTGTLTITLGNRILTGSDEYLVNGQITDEAYITSSTSKRTINLYATCAVEDVNSGEMIEFKKAITTDSGGGGQISTADGVYKVIVGIE